MAKRRHPDIEPATGEGAGSIQDRSYPVKRHKDAFTQPSEASYEKVVNNNKNELLEILQSVKDGKVSIDEAPPKLLTKLLRTMVSELDSRRQQNPTESPDSEAHSENNTPPATALAVEAGGVGLVEKTYENAIRPLLPLTAWTVSDIPKHYPPLPPILDPTQEKLASTHQGTREKGWHLSYENFEFLGDAFIYHVASEYITQTFPTFTPGRCSQIRERLLRNTNLAQYSLHYGMDKRAKLPEEFKGDGRSGGSSARLNQRQKVYADLFEAYIGALIRSDPTGVERARQWLKPLWAMTIAQDIRDEYKRRMDSQSAPGPARGTVLTRNGTEDTWSDYSPKLRLGSLVGCPGVKARFEDAPGKPKKDKKTGLPLFTIEAWVDGWGKSERLGFGSGLSKKDAGYKAAEHALQNKKLLKFFIDKKAAYMAAREGQAAHSTANI